MKSRTSSIRIIKFRLKFSCSDLLLRVPLLFESFNGFLRCIEPSRDLALLHNHAKR